jgi:DNA helicase-2/ATP-dependent DNA helicase PcrA
MQKAEIDLLAIDHGTVTAPAGCGKTHLIAEALSRHTELKPVLILTHTNAGVVALRSRLRDAGVPPRAYRLSTIDGWAMRLISAFPVRSGHNPRLLEVANPSKDYPGIREAAVRLLKSGHIGDVIVASYSRLIVDEYQDCSVRQHALVAYAACSVHTCVLGDPMQAIFDFGGDALAKWEEEVCKHFPIAGELSTPWRWINAGHRQLGDWLLDVRSRLIRKEEIDIRSGPPEVTWVELGGADDHKTRLVAATMSPPAEGGKILIIGDSKNSLGRHKFASQTPGAVTIEAVDLRDLVEFARRWDLAQPSALAELLAFAQSVMTNVGATELQERVTVLARGSARKPPTEVESAALAFVNKPTHPAALVLLEVIGTQGGVRRHRPALLRACVLALQTSDGTVEKSFIDSVVRVREQFRLIGRPLPRRAVGSTLLLKGLEAEAVVILDADDLNVRNLYVAMTRGSKMLVVCSRERILNPS